MSESETLHKLHALRQFAQGDDDVAILLHPDPDPDALASALAARALLRRNPDRMPIVTLGAMTRPENRRMAELLRMRVTPVTELEVCRLKRVISLDFHFSPPDGGESPRIAIIDHHAFDGTARAEFADVRPQYGATATIMTEYLRLEHDGNIARPLATALLYGIKTDTDSLSRGASPADVEAYAFLQACADLPLLRRLERPSYSIETARMYGAALMHTTTRTAVAATFLGEIADADAHVLADIADFCLGLQEITWSVAGAIINDRLVLTIRCLGGGNGARVLAELFAEDGGSGGGHDTMARVVLPLQGEWARLRDGEVRERSEWLSELIESAVEGLRVSPRSSPPARQETVPSSTRG
ncbi:MAG: DHH family phosphoesterase [Gemmatimonadota bacterium]